MKIKYPKKSLGQNFLTDKNIIDIIIKEGNLKETYGSDVTTIASLEIMIEKLNHRIVKIQNILKL